MKVIVRGAIDDQQHEQEFDDIDQIKSCCSVVSFFAADIGTKRLLLVNLDRVVCVSLIGTEIQTSAEGVEQDGR